VPYYNTVTPSHVVSSSVVVVVDGLGMDRTDWTDFAPHTLYTYRYYTGTGGTGTKNKIRIAFNSAVVYLKSYVLSINIYNNRRLIPN
jgi:hypothetical protein